MSNPMNAPSSPVNGTLIMGLGIASIFCFGIILGPITLVLAKNAMATLQTSGDPTNQMQNVNIGRICGIIGTIFGVLSILYYVLVVVLAVGGGLAGHHAVTTPSTTPATP